MLSRKILKAALLASLLMSPAAKAVDVFGYATFDFDMRMTSDPKVSNGAGGTKSDRPGQFDTQFFALMFQHEHDIYKFFSEVEFFHAPEFVQATQGSKLDGSWGDGSALKIERLYIDMAFHKMFNMRLGKSLPPLIWKANHYPSIVKPVTKPEVVNQGIAAGGYTGPQVFGQLGYGLNYNVWFYRNQYDDMAPSTGDTYNNDAFNRYARLAYKYDFSGGNLEVSVINGVRETSGGFASSRSEFDLNMTYQKFSLWMENASRTLAGASGDMTGMYVVAAYAMEVGGKELSPFIMYDTYKASKTADDKTLTAVGINYRPTPITEHKVEYSSIAKGGTTIAAETWLKYQFIYFFN